MSSQSLLSLSLFYKCNENELWNKISSVLASNNIQLISSEIAVYLSQQLVCEEFEERMKNGNDKQQWIEQQTSIAYNRDITMYNIIIYSYPPESSQESCIDVLNKYQNNMIDGLKIENNIQKSNQLPLLTSSCPAYIIFIIRWICFSEKTHSELLPYISNVMPPLQILGNLIKSKIYKGKKIILCAIEPCYDKKLEANRSDYKDPDTNELVIDCVLTTEEFRDYLNTLNIPTKDVHLNYLPEILSQCPNYIHGEINPDYSSDGYIDTVIRYISEKYGNTKIIGKLNYIQTKNKDFHEISLIINDKELKFARVYGFRNIQNIVNQLKRGKCKYQMIEIMACPSGCINGGGQIKEKGIIKQTELLETMKSNYLYTINPYGNIFNYLNINGINITNEEKEHLLLTRYHAVPKIKNILKMTW